MELNRPVAAAEVAPGATPPPESTVTRAHSNVRGRVSRQRRRFEVNLVNLITGMVVFAAACLIVAQANAGGSAAINIPWLVLLVGFVVGDRLDVNVDIRDGSLSMTLSQLVLVVGLFSVGPVPLVAARVLGGALSLLLLPDERNWSKSAFNVALFFLEAALAEAIFQAIVAGDGSPLGWRGPLAAVVATVVTATAGAWLIATVIRVTQPLGEPVPVGAMIGQAVAGEVVNVALGILAAILLTTVPWALVLLVPPAAVCLIAYRGHVKLNERHERLGHMSRFAHALALEADLDEVVRLALQEAADVLRAETAELLLIDGPTGPQPQVARWVGYDVSTGEVRALGTPQQGAADPLLGKVVTTRKAAAGTRPPHGRAAGPGRAQSRPRDGIAVPVFRGNNLLGVLAVRRRMGQVKTFGPDDRTMLSTLADNAGVACANCWLIEALRIEASQREQEALHDALTGLGNRRQFNERLSQALQDARSDGTGLAVLLMDLNNFKDVNDTLGHAAGDRLLQTVASRLAAVVGTADGVARLGGDEFAILVGATTANEAFAFATRVLSALETPVPVDGVPLAVSAAVGVACFPEHATDSSLLLQRADMALYAAKEQREHAIQVFSPRQGRTNARRIELAADLRDALDAGTLDVHYQPQADLRTGRLLAVEALLRWQHPRLGAIPPEEIVAISERINLIDRLTAFVLDRAVGQAASWRQDGLDIEVAVNISARNLLEPLFAAQLAIILERHDVPPGRIILEITETELMSEAERTVAVLDRLHDLGVGLAIDDFGTGYSSLAYLRRLPVSEVKIDRSFVVDLAADPNDAIIARTIVDLASNLSLRVVAEGIEDQRTWDLLEEMGCDRGQGYHLSRPMSAAVVADWATARGALR